MVLIAAAVCTKSGKVIISRQFVEMTKVRIEGLLAAFPKLMTTGKQHTFVETDSVRYVYQPLEKLYMLLITTKASNILEDLETLRLFSKVVPEYCHYFDEKDILENAFNLIFAFDEIVALGYRESVNLSQIKTFVEMDSHEEKVYQAVRQTQEREAKQKMREKAKELQRQRMESAKRGSSTTRSHGDFDSDKSRYVWTFKDEEDNEQSSRQHNSGGGGGGSSSSVKQQKPSVPKNALKLGGKSKDVDSFVDQLKNEGEQITSTANASASAARAKIPTDEPTERVHLKMEDKLLVRLGRDGRLNTFELSGLLTLRISDEKFGRIKVKLENNDTRGIQLQTHPNVDKDLFRGKGLIGLKNPAKPFPLNTDVGVLKWRYQTQEERALPLMINCWPTENTEGGFDINIEYELEHLKLELQDVCIAIPLPIGITPTVGECDGTYEFDSKKRLLLWNLPIVDATNKAGSLEFSVSSAHAGDFFPIEVSFASKTSYADLKATDVVLVDDESPVKYSTKTFLLIDKYEVV